jgi:hypothetical protein
MRLIGAFIAKGSSRSRGVPRQRLDSRVASPILQDHVTVHVPVGLKLSKFAHDRALHYLARQREYKLTEQVHDQLIEVVDGRHRTLRLRATKRGIEWMRDQVRARGETPRF